VVVVLMAAMVHGLAPQRVERLRQVMGIDEKTLERWRTWWMETFVQGGFWKGAKGRLERPADERRMPFSLMKAHGMLKRRRLGGRRYTAGAEAAEQRFEDREIRSYECEYVNVLWHLDFHHGSLPVLTSPGQWEYPVLLGILDDHSRLCCHAQWYLSETTEVLAHGLHQAFLKRDLCRALMSDQGSAMKAAETVQGLQRLSVLHEMTLPYSPYQNGKQESFWGQVEGRPLAMLAGCKDLTLRRLNEATLAWVEMEYNRKVHSETGRTPLSCFVEDKDVGRRCPCAEDLEIAFTAQHTRTQRRC